MASDSEIEMNESSKPDSAPFNMALRTLEKIHDISRSITIASSKPYTGEMTSGKSQHLKYTLIKQLFIQSLSLVTKETQAYKDKVWVDIKNIKLEWKLLKNNSKVVGMVENATNKIEIKLDELTMEILDKLQVEGYFMPPRNDVGLTWRRGGG